MERAKAKAALEAILFTMGDSVTIDSLAAVIEEDKKTTKTLLEEMMKDYNELDPDSQAVIKNYCSKVQAGLANNKERLICPSNKLNIDDEVQRYREELELEARQAGKSSAYENTGEINKKQA